MPQSKDSDEVSAPENALLHGVKVLDFTSLLPGPFATSVLADLGADVIKVEPLGGEFGRQFPTRMFDMANRNKRAISLNLKNPASRPVIERLVRWADIAAEGFRPGVADRLNIGPTQLREIKPELVYCSLSGYGQTGPWRDWPGHDGNYLAAAGALSYKGHWNDQHPRRSGIPIADLAGGSYMAISALAALMRARSTGQGATIDLSLTEAAMSMMSVRNGLEPGTPERLHLQPTNDLFETADGRIIAIGIVEDHFWQGFAAAAADLDEELSDQRFQTEPKRREHGDELSERMQAAMIQRSASEWLDLFAQHDVPGQLILTPHEATESEQAKSRGIVQDLDGQRHFPFPAIVDGIPQGQLRSVAPELGQNDPDILAELGFSSTEIKSLSDEGAFRKR